MRFLPEPLYKRNVVHTYRETPCPAFVFFNRKFHAEGAAFSFEEDKSRTGRFHICVNDIPLVQWLRQKAHEWRNGLGLTTAKQRNWMKI